MTFTEFTEEIAVILGCDPNTEGILSAVKQHEIEADMLSNSITSLACDCNIKADAKTDLQNVSAIRDYIRSIEINYVNICNSYHDANKSAANWIISSTELLSNGR